MTQLKGESFQQKLPILTEQIRTNMRHIARRQWRLWSTAAFVTMLLTVGIASFAFPGLMAQDSTSFLKEAVRGLIGIVLVFIFYVVHQQLQISRVQQLLANQLDAMTQIELRTEEVYQIAVLDPLTGIHNRRFGEQRLSVEMARAQRFGSPLSVVMLDLDHLKQVNDNLGHAAGDELIKYFASRLVRAIRGCDLAVRLGGDEFLLILPECKSDEIHHVLSRLTGMTFEFNEIFREVTFSSGWTAYKTGDSLDELLERADQSLYGNKRAKNVSAEVEAYQNDKDNHTIIGT
jgi:diguanylate cyclase (GGDEF)-like protein